MTPRELALMSYFHAVALDEKVKEAGFDARRLKDAVLACVAEDVPAVLKIAFRGAAGAAAPRVRQAAQAVAASTFTGAMPEGAAKHAVGVVDELLVEGFKWLDAKLTKGNGSRR